MTTHGDLAYYLFYACLCDVCSLLRLAYHRAAYRVIMCSFCYYISLLSHVLVQTIAYFSHSFYSAAAARGRCHFDDTKNCHSFNAQWPLYSGLDSRWIRSPVDPITASITFCRGFCLVLFIFVRFACSRDIK